MIRGEHSVLRTALIDDAEAFSRLFSAGSPRAPLLDQRQEWLVPTLHELRHALSGVRQETYSGLNVVENLEGDPVGFCVLRRGKSDPLFSQMSVMLFDASMYTTELANEVGARLIEDGFGRNLGHKLMAQCLCREPEYRAYLAGLGFESDGVQREVLYANGRWHDMESLSLFARSRIDSLGTSGALR